MTVLERMKNRIKEANELDLSDCIETAQTAILNRRFPFGAQSVEKDQYLSDQQDLVYRVAIDLYNKSGAEGELGHTENGINRQYESSWISEQLLSEIIPKVKVFS